MTSRLQTLSPLEFESLSADIMGAVYSVYFERFGEGTDGGIDGRICKTSNINWIIQAKRYKDNSSLLYQMKKEKIKMDKINPQRYFLITASSLNPQLKDKIKDVMSPYILSTADIYGAEDIAALLDEYPSIYKKHYKLWLNSSHELNFIKNNEYYNRSSSELDRIIEELKYFVSNKETQIANEILNKNHYLLIAGDPGSGKSITAGHLALEYFLAENTYEFHFLRDRNLRGVIDLVQKGTKQVFILDDFLGASFLHSQDILSIASDFKTLINIAINFDGDIKLIFTSRDYIINQMFTQLDDAYSLKKLLSSNTIINTLQDPIFRANLIYNYFTSSKLREIQKEKFLENKLYHELIKHQNFNPRLLKQMFESADNNKNEDISIWCIEQLDEPAKLWKKPFMTLSNEAQTIMYLLSLIDGEILLENLRDEYEVLYYKMYGKISTAFNFDNALDELEPNFINSFIKDEFLSYSIANGGIRDFVHITLANNKLLINIIIDSFEHFDLGAEVFGFSLKDKKPIQLTSQQKEKLNKKLIDSSSNSLKKISINTIDENDEQKYKKTKNSIGTNLINIWQIVSNDKASALYTIKEIEIKLQDETLLLEIIKTQRIEMLMKMIDSMTPIFQNMAYKLIIQNMINSEDASVIAKSYKENKILKNIIDKNRNKILKQMESICIEELEKANDESYIETIVGDIYIIEEIFPSFDIPSSLYSEKLHRMFQGTYDYDDNESINYWKESNPYEKRESFLEKVRTNNKDIEEIFSR